MMSRNKVAALASFAACCVASLCVFTLLHRQSPKRAALVSEFYGEGSLNKKMFSGRCRLSVVLTRLLSAEIK